MDFQGISDLDAEHRGQHHEAVRLLLSADDPFPDGDHHPRSVAKPAGMGIKKCEKDVLR